MATRVAQRRERIYVGGEWRETGGVIEVSDLADGGTFAGVAAARPTDAREALDAAHAVKPALRQTTVVERAEWCESIASGLREREEELAEIIVREAGKPISSARGEVDQAAERFDRAAEEARNIVSKGEFREGSTAGHEGWQAIVKHEPIGAVLCITPYNYPLATTALQVAPALAAGNSVLLKPASKTPLSAAILADVISEVDGIPDGGFNFVPGNASEIGDVLAGDDRVNAIAMTGSSGAGNHVARESGMVNLHMELGGNAPAIVFDDADLSDVAGNCAKGSFKYAGQRCSAVSRVLAHESVHDDLVGLIEGQMDAWQPGDLFDEDTTVGPLISEAQADWVETLVEDAIEKGADLVRGGQRRAPDGVPDELGDQFFEPTLLANVPHDARVVDEEQFGPIAAITTFEDEDEAVELANGSDLALDAAVFTNDYKRAMRVAELVDAGAVRINGAPSHGLGDVPFGGNKDSGIGREGLDASIHEMMRKKSIVL
ncbi:aldehyde dehydrogenase family protein [Natrarchaeobaculum sulfurireducens]|uniref:Non-phosphorylating glyceraldehyde-3-phosphatedehydrogenase (NADP) n=1 Tax=Natrarchaeobaculum sulfurireducens TaxID=2044521 RepID=A0A346PQM9_9EURY|nr:aldehyde dehydrogenase family protein [Natrarchaeobaculum sulfurireducens]AXR81824.1 Non-phosphorylating glyceraldehyde-3-phosphatedehydrogenase (NADP) [Natrarchaeobaculum sulfurireducens]